MTGPDYDEDEPEYFRPVPHPDDRLWRHPSEMAAMHAAQANADTAKVPAVTLERLPRSRVHTGLFLAAGVVVIGAAALTLGVVSTRSAGPDTPLAVGEVAGILAPADAGSQGTSTSSDAAESAASTGIAAAGSQDQVALTDRLHNELATSLPRIQAATPTGMREGSGFFVTDQGHIATSAGLVNGADYVLAWTEDGRRWKAHVLAADSYSDVAVLKIDSDEWPAVSLGTGTDLWSGQYALSVDHAGQKMTVGEVTSVEPTRVRISQPAAIAGSAVVDDTGAVIAMVNSGAAYDYATPAWLLERVTIDLIATGSTTHNWLGIGFADSTTGQMPLVQEVVADSPAERAGIRVGDAIDSIDGTDVASSAALWRHMQLAEPGDDLVLTVTREGNRRIIIATLDELPE